MATPKMATVTDLRDNLAEFLQELESGPLMLIQRSRPAGYLVGVEQFETLIEKLADLEDIVDGMQALQQIAQNPDLALDADEVFDELSI